MHVAPAQRRGALWPAIALGACLAGVHAEARAQDAPRERLRPAGRSASAAAAWVALTLTPDGALAPEAPPRAALDERVHVRVATLSRDAVLSQRAFGVTFDLPAGGSVLSLTGGWVQSRCERLEGAESSDVSTRCRGGAMAGARFGHVVVSRSWGAATRAVASVEATGGWADVTLMEQVSLGLAGTLRARAASATLALPLGLEVRRGRVAISPVVVPRLGYGHAVTSTGPLFLGTQGDETRAGGLFMLGGAIAGHIGERTALTVGLEQAFVHGGDPAWGFGLSIDL